METPQLDQPPPADFGLDNSYLDAANDGHASPPATAPRSPEAAPTEEETPCYGPMFNRRRRVNWQARSADLRPTPHPQLAIEGPPSATEPPEEYRRSSRRPVGYSRRPKRRSYQARNAGTFFGSLITTIQT